MCGLVVCTKIESEQQKEVIFKSLKKISYRGPDDHKILSVGEGIFAFHRLSIMDVSHAGDQPFRDKSKNITLVCNGEIYNYLDLKKETTIYPYVSQSDCEVILPLYQSLGMEKALEKLDGEFAFVIYDKEHDKYLAARDPMGIRPLFYGYTKDGSMHFASEVKSLIDFCDVIAPFPPGHYFDGKDFKVYLDYRKSPKHFDKLDTVFEKIHDHLTLAVEKRLQSDVPVGFLLSGGLDSSLVCAIAARKSDKPIVTFAIGIDDNPIDTHYARIVAEHIGSIHHEVLFTKEEMLEALDELVYKLETFDITTIRASVGMYLLCKYIREKTDIKVVLTGECSDELFGYKYTDFAPSALEFQEEAEKRIEELYMYDVLRADRCISSNSLEARVPFSDKDFVQYIMGIQPKLKMNSYQMGKYLLRKAFDHSDYLPSQILYRDKAAFSDAVGHAMVDTLKFVAEQKYTQKDLEIAQTTYQHATPFTKESLMYRELFEKHFAGYSHLIKDFWMPNKSWENCNVDDPSARVLPNYGLSGSAPAPLIEQKVAK